MTPRYALIAVWYLAVSLGRSQVPTLPDAPITTFGVTVVDPFGLRGDIYMLSPQSDRLPKFDKMKSVGVIYTSALNIPPRNFTDGFPGVTDRFEWFAIDYAGYFYIDSPGVYRFLLASDDGSKLYIDDKRIIDNDGVHPMVVEQGRITLRGGIHRIRISYFQGPGDTVALILAVARPGEDWRLFSTDEFRPPRNPADWKYGDPDRLPDKDSGARQKK